VSDKDLPLLEWTPIIHTELEDEIICLSVRRNRDGSITAEFQINIYDGEASKVYSAYRKARLRPSDWRT
jgi:hypothetical protein